MIFEDGVDNKTYYRQIAEPTEEKRQSRSVKNDSPGGDAVATAQRQAPYAGKRDQDGDAQTEREAVGSPATGDGGRRRHE